MTKLNQIIAVEKGVKTDSGQAFTRIYHQLQKTALFAGLIRTYKPRDDEGEKLPGEGTKVQLRAETLLDDAATALTRLFDVTITKDHANGTAIANVVVDGVVLLNDVPVTTLLFLEKQLVDLRTVISKLPVLDPSEDWEFNETVGAWATTPAFTTRTKKIPRTLQKAPATEKHPAQVDVWMEDTVVGDWTVVKFSGAVPQTRVDELLGRVEALRVAVKYAREEANSVEVVNRNIGKKIFDYLFA